MIPLGVVKLEVDGGKFIDDAEIGRGEAVEQIELQAGSSGYAPLDAESESGSVVFAGGMDVISLGRDEPSVVAHEGFQVCEIDSQIPAIHFGLGRDRCCGCEQNRQG